MQGVPETGDSLVRLLLNVTGVQTALACFILRTLPKVQETAGSQNADSMPQLILGSLRWYLPQHSTMQLDPPWWLYCNVVEPVTCRVPVFCMQLVLH